MRTLVIGIPLPHVSFDNYSFLSAPAFSEYERLIVEPASVSNTVEEVISAEGEHRDFAGHIVHNAPSSSTAFSLQDLLEMRRRESEWFFRRGGVLVCFSHPDVAHSGVAGSCGWRRYSWLPAPPGFRFEEHLLPGFGTPGAQLVEEDHPFASYITDLAQRVAYRATIDDDAPGFGDYGRIFARSLGGAPIAAELKLDAGRIILLPPLVDPAKDRTTVAQTLSTCLNANTRCDDTPRSS